MRTRTVSSKEASGLSMVQDRDQDPTRQRRTHRRLTLLFGSAILVADIGAAARPASPPVDSFAALDQVMTACWKPRAGSEGSEITLKFGLTGQGALRGPPMVTYSKLLGPKELQKAFVLTAL